ncbi:MAG TPA: hypothetical protein VKT32_17210, partial [Chthonomonadaceae bacterium]|nr:hypothetical protein [Chthonomonadaceae bacterium]
LSGATVTRTQDKYGKVSGLKTEGFQGPMANANFDRMFTQSMTGFYPDKTVKVGDSWKFASSYKMGDAPDVKLTGSSTLLGTETLGGVKTLKIKTLVDSADKDSTAGTFHAESTGNVDAQTGKVIRVVAKVSSEMGPNKIKGDTTMTLLTEKTSATTPASKP